MTQIPADPGAAYDFAMPPMIRFGSGRTAEIGGREVTRQAVDVLLAVGGEGFEPELGEGLVGGAAIDTHGAAIRPDVLEAAKAADAVLLGAVGGPKWDDPRASVRPEQALFALRKGLGLFANLRPVRVLDVLDLTRTSERAMETKAALIPRA